ncbi:bifunctional riboflavin kinase/FAD synthetase [Solicola sp. PLA-1-18]|uniref:bifunctional riboflavin kinase/FAD synthetase n=1 Tax=Solicola sp. PLA-1-18 TaxID=3380532 RepID=UPI003B7AC642
MDVWHEVVGTQALPLAGRSVVSVGNFDGVHRGHQHVLRVARDLAASLGADAPLPVVAATFEPHPLAVLAPDKAPLRLTTPGQRARLLRAAGADVVAELAFSREMAAWTPEEFVERVLVEQVRAAGVVVGENFRFGHRAAGDVTLLRELGREHDFVVESLQLDGGTHPWSSTLVRRMLADGDVEGATEVLGRAPAVEGVVVRGDQRGRELGYPTANLPVAPGWSVPSDGVYAGWLRRLDDDSAPLPAAISVGTNPTFDGLERRVESYVLDRTDLELYGVPVEVTLVGRIRGQVRFEGIDALVEQMSDDVARTRELLSGEHA